MIETFEHYAVSVSVCVDVSIAHCHYHCIRKPPSVSLPLGPWRLGIGNMSDEPSSRAAQVLEGEAQMVNPEMLALGLVHESQFRCMYCGADPEKDADPVTARHFEIQLDLVLWSLVGSRIGFLLECWSRLLQCTIGDPGVLISCLSLARPKLAKTATQTKQPH